MSAKVDVGLLTWHYHTNVGSCLQAYALFRAIKNAGYSVKFINYRPKFSSNRLKNNLKAGCGWIAQYYPKLLPQRIHAQAYRFQQQFFDQTHLYVSHAQLTELNGKFGMYLCGSDQIWAPNVLDDAYLLSFADENTPKYSYASSIGLPVLPDALQPIYKHYLNRFSKITVREQQGALLLKHLLEKPIEVALDPTFLLEGADWRELAILPKFNNPFLFCYLLGKNESHRQWIEAVSQKYHLPVICATPNPGIRKPGWTYLTNLGPRQFLGYIQQAKVIISDSFHGMALSVNQTRLTKIHAFIICWIYYICVPGCC